MEVVLDFEKAKASLSPHDYREILSTVRLADLSLEELHTSINRGVLCGGTELGLQVRREFGQDLTDSKEPLLFVKYRVRGMVRRTTAVEIRATYRLHLKAEAEPPPEFVAVYAHVSADVQTWPFLRQIAEDLTSQMGAPRLVLPMLRDPSVLSPD
jgi:hypothetical protein